MKLIRYFSAYFFKGIAVLLISLAIYTFYHAIIILPLSIIPLEIEGTDAFESQKWELYGEVLSIIIYAILAIIFAPKCFSKARKLMQKRKKSIEVKYNEPFVLYLRSFVSDNDGKKVVDPLFSMGSTEEEALINVLSEVAPVFAIGNPLDKYTPLGANRVYVENNEWKNKVIEMAKFAKIVVLRLGETDNFWWEVEMCFSTIDKNKLLFIVPHSRNFSTVAILYKYLIDIGINVEDLNVEISKTSKGSISSFIYLGADGSLFCKNMKLHKLTSWIISYENMIRNSLSSFFVRYGLFYQKQMNVSKARLMQITAILVTLIYISLYGYFGVYEMQHKTPLTNDKTIILFVNKTNKACPILIDSDTELDKVLITRNNELQFNITIIHWRKDSLDVQVFKKSMEKLIVEQIKTNPSMKYFRENNTILSYNYKDRNGASLTNILISPEKYKEN